MWASVLKRSCIANDISFSVYPIHRMSLPQIEGAATALSRILRVAQRESKEASDTDVFLRPRSVQKLSLQPTKGSFQKIALAAGGRYLFGATSDTIYLYDLHDFQHLRHRSTPRCVAARQFISGKGIVPTVKTWPTPDNEGIEVMIESES